jgi:hypothetical protein
MGKIVISDKAWERDYLWEGLPLLHCACVLPQTKEPSRSARRMERYWRHWEKQLLVWLEEYYARCCVLACEALEQSKPLPLYRAEISYKIAYQDDHLLSLLLTIRTAGKVRRIPELWELRHGTPVNCRKLLSRSARRKRKGRVCLLTEQGVTALGEQGDELLLPIKEIKWKP